MAWYLGGVRIFVNESKEDAGQIVPRLQPLGGPTVLQIFGYESDIRHLNAVVVGLTDKDALKDMRTTGDAYLLTSPVVSGSFYVKKVVVSQVQCICQTLRSDLDADAPVFNAEIELYE